MPQYFTDFSEYTVGNTPSDWVEGLRAGNGFYSIIDGGAYGNVLQWEAVTFAVERVLVWTEVPASVDTDIIMLCRETNAGDPMATARYDGGDDVNGNCHFGGQRANGVRSGKVLNGTVQNDGFQGANFESSWMWVRFQTIGSARRTRTWLDGTSQPSTWNLDQTDTAIPGAGQSGLYAISNGNTLEVAQFGVGTNGDSAPTAPVGGGGETGALTNSAAGSEAFSATCATYTSTADNATASDSLSVIASINTSIISAAQAADQSGESPAAQGSLESAATGSDLVDALASAAASLSAGASAGESWAAQAQVAANLLSGAASADQIARATESAVNAAVNEGSAASNAFVAALEALAGTEDTATTNDAFVAVVAMLGGISSGAIASDSFGVNFGQIKAIESGAITSDAWILAATLSADLSDLCTAQEIMQARADVTTSVTFGAIASDTFAIVNAGIKYLVMGAITLRTALNQSITAKPALNQSVTIKPGH